MFQSGLWYPGDEHIFCNSRRGRVASAIARPHIWKDHSWLNALFRFWNSQQFLTRPLSFHFARVPTNDTAGAEPRLSASAAFPDLPGRPELVTPSSSASRTFFPYRNCLSPQGAGLFLMFHSLLLRELTEAKIHYSLSIFEFLAYNRVSRYNICHMNKWMSQQMNTLYMMVKFLKW